MSESHTPIPGAEFNAAEEAKLILAAIADGTFTRLRNWVDIFISVLKEECLNRMLTETSCSRHIQLGGLGEAGSIRAIVESWLPKHILRIGDILKDDHFENAEFFFRAWLEVKPQLSTMAA